MACEATRAFDLPGFWHSVVELAVVSKIGTPFALWPIEAVALQKTRHKWGGGNRTEATRGFMGR